MKLLPIQIILVIIGGANSIIDNGFAGNLIGSQAMAVTGLFSPVIVISAVLLFVCEFFSDAIATALGAQARMALELASYIRGFSFGLPFFVSVHNLRHFCSWSIRRKEAMLLSLPCLQPTRFLTGCLLPSDHCCINFRRIL
ncbi:MAG: hypothetical protein K6E16_08815 [Lachnospiraceae bacterium]|nr:hypothetical protein [Lachnospiraceae bacterium]